MDAKAAMSVEEYLHTSFPDLDKEYWDGELVERSLPDWLHGKTQGLFVAFFLSFRKTLPVFAGAEIRMKIRERLYLIPDVAVFYPNEPKERYPSTPPLIVIEVLSLDDRPGEIRRKLEEFRTWGVPHVWFADPHARRLYRWDGELVEVDSLTVPELGIEVKPADIFE